MRKKKIVTTSPEIIEKLKDKEKDILLLVYRYRFLDRNQIQTLLNHKQFNRVIVWLNNLTEKKYLRRYYVKTIQSTPALYSLGTKGRKYFMENSQEYNIRRLSILDRVWYEKANSYEFRSRLQFVADIYLSLLALTKKTGATLKFYTKVDLDGIKHLPKKLPDGFFSITEKNGSSKRFFLVLFRPYELEKKVEGFVRMYFAYYKYGTWQKNNPNPFPEIIFITGENKTKHILENYIKNKLKRERRLVFSLATKDAIKKSGINKKVLEKVTI